MNSKKHSIRYNFAMNFVLTATQFLFPLITFPYISRVLQSAGNGRVSFASSVSNYFMMMASLGIPTYGVRACAQVRDDKEKLSKTVQEIFVINFVMTIAVITTYLVAIYFVPRLREDKILFYINGLNILMNMFGMNWLYQALEQYDYITVRSITFKIISIFLMFAFVHKQDDYIIYGGITVFAAVGSYVLNFVRSIKIVNYKLYSNYGFKRHIKPILILFAQSLAVSIYTNLDTVMLGFMRADVDVGYYNAAVKIKTILLSLVTSLGNVLLPRMSYFAKEKKYIEFKQTMLKALNFTLLMSIPLVLYFDIFANESINFLAGEGYAEAVPAMQIITIAVIPNGMTGVLGIQVLTAIEKEKYVLYSVIVGAVLDFFLNFLFIPLWGASGAALATVVAEFIVLVMQMYYTRFLLREVKDGFRIHIYIILSILAGGSSFVVKKMAVSSNFMLLVISAIIYFGVYGIGLLITKESIFVEIFNIFKKKIMRRK